jgi:hypothetical protein
MSVLYLRNGSRWFRSWGVYDTPWSILLNTTLPHTHYTNTEILSSGPFLRTPHLLWGLAFIPLGGIHSRKCLSVSCLGSGWTDGRPCTGWRTPELCTILISGLFARLTTTCISHGHFIDLRQRTICGRASHDKTPLKLSKQTAGGLVYGNYKVTRL